MAQDLFPTYMNRVVHAKLRWNGHVIILMKHRSLVFWCHQWKKYEKTQCYIAITYSLWLDDNILIKKWTPFNKWYFETLFLLWNLLNSMSLTLIPSGPRTTNNALCLWWSSPEPSICSIDTAQNQFSDNEKSKKISKQRNKFPPELYNKNIWHVYMIETISYLSSSYT